MHGIVVLVTIVALVVLIVESFLLLSAVSLLTLRRFSCRTECVCCNSSNFLLRSERSFLKRLQRICVVNIPNNHRSPQQQQPPKFPYTHLVCESLCCFSAATWAFSAESVAAAPDDPPVDARLSF